MVISDTELKSVLLPIGLIEEKKLTELSNLAKQSKTPLSRLLIDKDVISDENLGRIIADYKNLPFVSLSKVSIPQDVLKIIPEIVAKKQKTIVFGKGKDGLQVATSEFGSKEFISFIEKKTGEKVMLYFATERDIDQALRLYRTDIQKTFDELLNEQLSLAVGKNWEAPIAKIVGLLIEYSYSNRASDIHIEPGEKESLIRFRVDGILHDVLHLPKNIHDQIIARIKVLSKLRTDEHLSAQDGKMQAKLEEENLDIRISIVPVVDGEKVVMRLLSSKFRQFSLADLGMRESDLAKVKEGYIKPFGMVLSTGPTGSGKTTSIYAIVKLLNTRDKNIATIEDPVEYDIEGINQIHVNPKTNLTFANGLRAILRQDPDIIFVGEIRDPETADIAVNSAMTGHLVLSTLHTNDAATTLPRLIDMGIEPFLVASTVNVIIGQRLVRKICEKCRVSVTTNIEEVAKHLTAELIKKQFGDKKEIRLYHGKGCPVCQLTGYSGRIGVFEVLKITESIRQLINSKASSDLIVKKATEEGMTTMIDDGMDKVLRGITTIEEVLRATKE